MVLFWQGAVHEGKINWIDARAQNINQVLLEKKTDAIQYELAKLTFDAFPKIFRLSAIIYVCKVKLRNVYDTGKYLNICISESFIQFGCTSLYIIR